MSIILNIGVGLACVMILCGVTVCWQLELLFTLMRISISHESFCWETSEILWSSVIITDAGEQWCVNIISDRSDCSIAVAFIDYWLFKGLCQIVFQIHWNIWSHRPTCSVSQSYLAQAYVFASGVYMTDILLIITLPTRVNVHVDHRKHMHWVLLMDIHYCLVSRNFSS